MRLLKDFEIGVMFWGNKDPAQTLRELKELGVVCGQLGVPGDMDLSGAGAAWKRELEDANFTINTVFAAYTGESYADIPTVKRTVGFIPQATRQGRERRTLEVSDFAAELGVPSIATHVGFVPEDTSDPDYIAVRELVRRVCDHAARQHGQTFALETGQEAAPTLLDFIHDVNRPNLGINFDPANMILYGTGDPIEALGVLGEHVLSVHCKDGDWPPENVAGALGSEKALGQGAVGMDRFLRQLKHVGYKGPLTIERETDDAAQRIKDLRMGVGLMQQLRDRL